MDAIDLSHHLSPTAAARTPNPLKSLMKYMSVDGMVSLAGGLPHPSLFPFVNIEAEVYSPGIYTSESDSELLRFNVHKNGRANGQVVDLATGLQYAPTAGFPWLLQYVQDFVSVVYQPAYKNYDVLMNDGSTDGWSKVVNLLCEPGNHIFLEKYTFPSTQAMWVPMGCKGVPLEMDANGIRADVLENTLREWDNTHPGVKRPHVLYVIPTGQNPTGCTMPIARKQEIYDICVKYDVIIVEDDPYYTLQFDTYKLPSTANGHAAPPLPYDEAVFLDSFVKTFLSIDVQGRVIRLDTFSKTMAPGNRLGWFTCNPLFAERIIRATEVTTQTPSGWSQSIISELLHAWGPGLSGYLRWLSGLQSQYEIRRNWMCDALAKEFDAEQKGDEVIMYAKGTKVKILSVVPPRAGMFLWCKVHLSENKEYADLKGASEDLETFFEQKLWQDFVDAKVLISPGRFYAAWEGEKKPRNPAERDIVHFRLAFSMTTKENVDLAIRRLANVLHRAWGLV
ncbi:PLP-dependent transferase [Desarmillaria tabescens]|uniref:PLP-dependent transferase n=1 Tax=Armillaria tabescens TaxID=1929756 RepID=A0AA39KCB9_ARMTA|nr:PLP-dependent transferase [Desarmillaria tabescens]KAK0457241.1 PLP-dependent transferase [Desarmillaria tabescens]